MKTAGWRCAQHASKDLSDWLDALGLDEGAKQGLCKLASNLNELNDIEEEDLGEISLSRVAEKKLRRALYKYGNQQIQAKIRRSVAPTDPGAQGQDIVVKAGAVLNKRFVIVRKLGDGGMGEVWLAKDNQLRRHTAIKIPQSSQMQERMQQEVMTLAPQNHPNIMRVYDMKEHGSLRYMVCEYINGTTLRERIATFSTDAVPESDIVAMALDVLAGE